jgi:acyl-CoA thioesterase-1
MGMLNRLDAAVPDGTRVVILQPGGNDARHGAASWRDANISQIVERLRVRQVAVIMLEKQTIGAIRRQGYGSDAQHLTAEGYRLLAAQLFPAVATALGLPPN